MSEQDGTRMSEDVGLRGDLKITIEPSNRGHWTWEVRKWNHRPSRWNRQSWIPVRSGGTLTETGARREARRAVRKIRFLEARKPVVYYDPPR